MSDEPHPSKQEKKFKFPLGQTPEYAPEGIVYINYSIVTYGESLIT